MIFIPIVWTHYTATANGQVLKRVPCEHCSTEYVYVLEREGEGHGTSLYLMNEDGARDGAAESAQDALSQYLANDFDPVPCPVCGQYQRYMFPKLYDGGSSLAQFARLAVLLVGCPVAVGALYWSIALIQRADAAALVRLGGAVAGLVALGLVNAALHAAERARVRRFDPNTEDQQARIAKGRSRAITLAEFEASQQRQQGSVAPSGAEPLSWPTDLNKNETPGSF